MTLRVVIADDEPLAVRRLQIALGNLHDIEIVGSAGDGEEALELITELSPDVVLLDIRMPKLSGLQLIEALDSPSPPAVIFITAYESFAVDAFREGAIDYLLKPLDEERLAIAVDRARRSLETRDAGERIAELRGALTSLQIEDEAREQSRYEKHLWVSSRGHVTRVPVSEVRWFQAEGDYVVVHAEGGDYLIHDSLRDLESRLDPEKFLRVHRSAIVATHSVAGVGRTEFGVLQLRLVDGSAVSVSRTYKKATRAALGI
ncbi:LytTR family DNA-binding domain-containing protein [Sphingomonas daechungensis]